MNKQEAIKSLQEMAQQSFEVVKINAVHIDNIVEVISQIDEPQKVVVPEFVAEWIKYCKHEKFYALHGAYDRMNSRLCRWRFGGGNSELFAKAWLAYPNIVVEKEEEK